MPREINLLPEKEASQERREALNKKVIAVSILILLATTALIVGTFAYWGITLREKNTITEEISDNTKVVESRSRTEFLQISLKAKLVRLKEVLEGQTDFEGLLSNIQEAVIDGISLNDLGISKSGDIVLTGQARTSISLSAFLNGLIDKEKAGRHFNNVIVKTVSSDKDGVYKFSITMKSANIKKEQKPINTPTQPEKPESL